jgi:hypothetical protein
MSERMPESWGCDSQVHSLRIELSSAKSISLPYEQLVFWELDRDGDDHCLRLIFVTHEIVLRGYYLKRVDMALQKRDLSFVAKVSEHYQSQLIENQPTIREIIVTEMKQKQVKEAGG